MSGKREGGGMLRLKQRLFLTHGPHVSLRLSHSTELQRDRERGEGERGGKGERERVGQAVVCHEGRAELGCIMLQYLQRKATRIYQPYVEGTN